MSSTLRTSLSQYTPKHLMVLHLDFSAQAKKVPKHVKHKAVNDRIQVPFRSIKSGSYIFINTQTFSTLFVNTPLLLLDAVRARVCCRAFPVKPRVMISKTRIDPHAWQGINLGKVRTVVGVVAHTGRAWGHPVRTSKSCFQMSVNNCGTPGETVRTTGWSITR